jgi:hypothetical protein
VSGASGSLALATGRLVLVRTDQLVEVVATVARAGESERVDKDYPVLLGRESRCQLGGPARGAPRRPLDGSELNALRQQLRELFDAVVY